MKIKHALIIFILGYCLDVIGALLKIMHHANADNFLIAGVVLKVAGLLIFLLKLLSHPKVKEFLNW